MQIPGFIDEAAALPASLGAGFIRDRRGRRRRFYVSATLTVIAAIMLAFAKDKKIRPIETLTVEKLNPDL